ncbi:hypothetical protein ABZY03_33855 [Streptomyces klenkii]|uniref:hypothetical protein n=1 Tax=Streptomyces klenkii TaxID=1420899 RepID=UPI0033B0337A
MSTFPHASLPTILPGEASCDDISAALSGIFYYDIPKLTARDWLALACLADWITKAALAQMDMNDYSSGD